MNQKTLILLICLFAISYQHGVHRVAQSMWNYPNFGSTTKLYLFFSLDEALPAGGVMNIALPATMAAFVPTSCNAWALTSSLTPPATTSGFMIGLVRTHTGWGCQFYTYAATSGTAGTYGGAVGLLANTAYGLELTDTDTALAIGSYAPIAITTRSGYDGSSVINGPMLGCNPAFDMVFVIAAPLGFTTATTRVADATSPACVLLACNSAKNQPGDAAMYLFSIGTWSGTTTSTVIPAPYNIEFSFTKTANSAAGHVYGTWSFAASATSVTSTQFGPALTNGTLPTMSVVKPASTYAANTAGLFLKTIVVTAAADDMRPVAGAWSTWIVSFTLEVTNPTDLVDTSPTLNTKIYNPLTNYIYAKSDADATTVFKVVIGSRISTSFDVAKDSVARVAFGADPMTSTGHLYGAGIYSEVFCVSSLEYNPGRAVSPGTVINVATLPSNCNSATADNMNVVYASAAGSQPARSVNAIEIAWTIPLAIPADTTGAVVTCAVTTAKIASSTNADYRFFKMHQASLATDVSKGNCWYSSTNSNTGSTFYQRELITCNDMAKVSANDILTIGFQFEIFQQPYKAYRNIYANAAAGQVDVLTAAGKNKVWTAGVVVKTILDLTCTMVITAGGKVWYTQSIIIPVDGSVAANDDKDFAQYQTFISQMPADVVTLDETTGRWAYANKAAGSLTHTWQTEPVKDGAFAQAGASNQDLTIALMFYIGDTYSDIPSLSWALVGGRKIPMVIKATMNLKFYLYGAHTFAQSTVFRAYWQGYGTGTEASTALAFSWQSNTAGGGNSADATKAMFFAGAFDGNNRGGLNVCADGVYSTQAPTKGLCYSQTGFTSTATNEGGKVFVSATSTAGGFTPGAVDSFHLQKACINNAVAVQTGGNLGNMFQSCKFLTAFYMTKAYTTTEHTATSGAFYVMFAGSLLNTIVATVDTTTGYVAPNFVAADVGAKSTFPTADWATYHKFTYTAAYAQSGVTWMTTFRGRGGQGASAKQGLETMFWGVKDNGTSATNTWVISTMIHTYIVAKLTPLAGTPTATKVTVSWPAWVEAAATAASVAIDSNDGLLFFNTVKMTVQTGYAGDLIFKANNAYVGAFMPRGQAFMKSTGDNQVEAVSTQTGTTCYLYGSQSGESYQTYGVVDKIGNIAKDNLRIFIHGNGLGAQLDTNFLVCSVGTVSATGVVTVIPFTNTYATTSDVFTSELTNLISGDWLWKLTLVIGSDRNMFFVGFYPVGQTLSPNTGYLAEIASNRYFENDPVALISSASNILTNFQVDGVTHADFKIGATGVLSKITATLGSGSAQNWLTGVLDLAQICGDATYLMGSNTGDVNTGAAASTDVMKMCLKHTQSVKIVNFIVAAQTDTTSRECWYCPMEAGTAMSWVILKFTVPVTSDRVVLGFAVQLSMDSGTKLYTSAPTVGGAILSNVDTITQCGVTPTSIQYNVKGKQVAWSVTSPTPLAGGWVIKFVGSSTTLGFFTVTDTTSVTTTCGTSVLATAQTMTVNSAASKSFITFTLGSVTAAANPTRPTFAAKCAGGSKFTATVNNWKGTASATAITAGNCVVLIAANAAKNTGLIGDDAYNGATSMAAALTFDQSVAGTATTLGITDISFYPTVSASYGRFRFRPSTTTALYAGKSIFTYTFGSATFSAGNVCKITDSTFTTYPGVVSSCVASGSGVTIKMSTAASSATFGVQIMGTTFSWAQAVQSITASLSNFADIVQSNPTAQVTLAALPATQTVKTTLVLTKTYKNTMDLGTFMFTTTIKTINGTFNSSQWAMIQFPTYYRADLGAGVLCNLNFNGTTTEPVWCELMWDYTLKVWGPITNAMFYNVAFNISVMGVDNVNPAAARDFQVGFSAMSAVAGNLGSSLTLTDSDCLMEFMTIVDTVEASGWKGALTSLKVWSYTSSGADTRSTTQVVIKFQVPTTTAATISDVTLGYVTLHLPKMWGNVIQSTTSLTTKLEQQATTTPFGMTEIGATSPATFSGCSVTVHMTGTVNKFVQGSNYTLTVGGIPTSQSAVPITGLMFPVLSVGKTTTGSLGWSDSQHNWMPTTNPTFAVKTGYTEVQFSATSYTVNQGTYSSGLCIMPTGTAAKSAKFNSDIEFAIVGTTFVTAPAKLTAKQGDVSVCASIGTSSATAQSWYWVTFTATSTKYTALPYLKVMVSNTKGQVTNTNEAACTLGYSSVPIKVGYTTAPFSDVIVTLNNKDLVNSTYTADNVTNNPSFGLTASPTQKTVTLTQLVSSGILSFTCASTLNVSVTTKLWYNLTGTDMASFTLQNADVKATGLVVRGDKIVSPVLALVQNNASSTAAMTYVNAGCPEVGTAYVWFAPSATTQPTATTAAAVMALADAYMTSTNALGYDSVNAHKAAQWFQIPVLSTNSPPVAADYVTASFNTVSNQTYTSMLYCATSTDYFYTITAPVAMTSKDNGGKVSNVELTYTIYFDEALHNADLLKVSGAMATGLMIRNDRVSDRWGGMFGFPSQFVPATAFTPQTAVTVTNTTNATNATNTTSRLLAASYPVNLFIQPDPTAATALDATAWTAAVTGIKSELSAAVTTYGAVASVAASTAAPSITEAAVAFSTDPTATSNADGSSVAVAGAVAGDSYVYCAFQKTGTAAATTARRILQNTTNATNTTTAAAAATPAVAATTTAAVATSMTSWSEASWTSAYTFMRSTTSSTVPTFTQSYTTQGGSTFKWACQGTSLNPIAANAQYMTKYKEGTVTATLAVTVGAGSLFSTIAAISFIIIAAFFY